MRGYKELMSNIKYGNVKRIKELLSTTNINDALVYAAKNSDLKRIKFLIEQGADINYDIHILEYTICHNDIESFKYLIGLGLKIFNVSLYKSIRENRILFAKYLINNGCTVDIENLKTVIEYSDLEMFKLLSKNIDIFNCNAFLYFAVDVFNVEIFKYLIEINYRYLINDALLISLHYSYKYEISEILFKIGADIHYNNDLPIKIASESNNIKAICYLIDKIDININNNMLIRNAIYFGSTYLIEILIKHGSNVDVNVINIIKPNINCYNDDDELFECLIKYFYIAEDIMKFNLNNNIKNMLTVYFRTKKIKQIC